MAEIGAVDIALVHGWAGFSSQWKSVHKRLSGFGNIHFLGESYVNSDLLETPKKEYDVIIAHSFGYRWILENNIRATKKLILLAPLSHFKQGSRGARSVKKMLVAAESNLDAVVSNFFSNAGYPSSETVTAPKHFNSEKLVSQLKKMIIAPENHTTFPPEVHIVESLSDKIVQESIDFELNPNTEILRHKLRDEPHFLFFSEATKQLISDILYHDFAQDHLPSFNLF